jgi:hypothetical protein
MKRLKKDGGAISLNFLEMKVLQGIWKNLVTLLQTEFVGSHEQLGWLR